MNYDSLSLIHLFHERPNFCHDKSNCNGPNLKCPPDILGLPYTETKDIQNILMAQHCHIQLSTLVFPVNGVLEHHFWLSKSTMPIPDPKIGLVRSKTTTHNSAPKNHQSSGFWDPKFSHTQPRHISQGKPSVVN